MEPVDILLFEEGDPNSGFRTQNAEGQKARSVLIDRGDVLVVRARLTSVTHGDYTPDGDAATLLVFDFNFLNLKQSRRFKNIKIILKFEDAGGKLEDHPEVVTIAPAGKSFINKRTDKCEITQSVNMSLNGSVAGLGSSVGYTWDKSQTKETDHATTIVGTKRLFAGGEKDNGVIWNLEEDVVRKDGIPSFLRAGVLLRRRDDVPFRFTIEVEAGVDFEGKFRHMLGLEKPDPVDPVELDQNTDLDHLGIASLEPTADGVDLKEMAGMDVGRIADVVLATLLPLE